MRGNTVVICGIMVVDGDGTGVVVDGNCVVISGGLVVRGNRVVGCGKGVVV